MYRSRLGKTTFWIVFLFWLLFTVYLLYQYLIFVSRDIGVKGGTFVEGVSDSVGVSYLPYSSFSAYDRFYQRFLFSSCLDYEFRSDGSVFFSESVCTVETNDNRRYQVSLSTGHFWSDGRPVSLQDIYFSYSQLVANNIWSLEDLSVYENVSVELGDSFVEVVFPDSSLDNAMFFTHFFMPYHVLSGSSFDSYLSLYREKPVYDGCATLRPQTVDDASLVFDLTNCGETNVLLYQLKLLSRYFLGSGNEGNIELYDFLYGVSIDGKKYNYNELRIPSRQYSMLFFNTESQKLSAKINRALGGFIFNHFYSDGSYQDYLLKDNLLFGNFLSTGDNVVNYIAAKNPSLPVDRYDLEKIDIEEIPQTVVLSGGQNFTYFVERFQGYKTVKFSVPDGYSQVAISHNDGTPYTPKTYDPISDTFFYSLAVYNNNIEEGLNEYVVEGTRSNGDKDFLGRLDLYYLSAPLDGQESAIPNEAKLQIVYFVDTVSQLVVDRLKSIFEEYSLSQYFVFQQFEDIDQFDGKLLSLDYDIVIRTVDLGLRADLSTLLGSTTPTLNPSVYSYDPFMSALSSYANGDQSVFPELSNIYMQDVPFVVLGNIFDVVYVDNDFESFFEEGPQGIYDFKKKLLENVSLTEQQSFDWDDVFDFGNLSSFFSQI